MYQKKSREMEQKCLGCILWARNAGTQEDVGELDFVERRTAQKGAGNVLNWTVRQFVPHSGMIRAAICKGHPTSAMSVTSEGNANWIGSITLHRMQMLWRKRDMPQPEANHNAEGKSWKP